MNSLYFASLLCMGVLVSASGWGEPNDGSWKGEGLAESQDNGHWDVGAPLAPRAYAPVHNWAPAPLGHDGRVIDTPEVAHAKAAHLSALAAARAAAPAPEAWAPASAHDSWASAPAHDAWAAKYSGPPAHIELTADGKNLKDTPEVAHAKAAHSAAVAAASHQTYGPTYHHNSW